MEGKEENVAGGRIRCHERERATHRNAPTTLKSQSRFDRQKKPGIGQ